MGYNVLIVESVSDHGVGSLCLPGAKSGLIKKRGFLLLVLFSFPVGRQHYVINTIAQVKVNMYKSCGFQFLLVQSITCTFGPEQSFLTNLNALGNTVITDSS